MFALLLHFYQKEVFSARKIFIFKKALFLSHFPVVDAMKTLWILAVIILGVSLRKYASLFTELGNQHNVEASFPSYYTDKWLILIVMHNYPNISLIPEERTRQGIFRCIRSSVMI